MPSFPTVLLPAGAVALMLPLAACSLNWNDDKEGSGVAATGSGTSRTYPVTGFSNIELRGSDDIDVRVGSGFSVRAEGPSDQLDRLRIAKDGDALEIGRRNGTIFGWSGGKDKVKIFVTLPRLTGASIAGSGSMIVDRVEGARFKGEIAGSGALNLQALAVEEAGFDIAGSGDIRAAGVAKTLGVEVAGSGSLDGASLKVERAEISVAGSGDIRAAVSGDAKVEVMGSGDVDLGPAARCRVSKMGSGTVRCGSTTAD